MNIKNPTKKNRKLPQSGFTLIEILVAVAIISLLAAIAIPQYLRFTLKCKRTEAYVLMNGVHTNQTGYFASHDQYYNVCGAGVSYCDATISGVVENQKNLGIDLTSAFSHQGYWVKWRMGSGPNTYELWFWADLVTDNFAYDMMALGVNTDLGDACRPLGYQDGVPFLVGDDITESSNCDNGIAYMFAHWGD